MTLKAEIYAEPAGLVDAVSSTLQQVTKLKGAVEILPLGALPNDGKVIADERPVGWAPHQSMAGSPRASEPGIRPAERFRPEEPRRAESGDGCALAITRWRLSSIRPRLACAGAPQSRNTTCGRRARRRR